MKFFTIARKHAAMGAALVLAFGAAGQALAIDPAVALKEVAVMLPPQGPGGEKPVTAADITLSNAELAQIRAKKAKAAIVMHYGGNDWSRAQVEGLKAQFKTMGIEVIAVTDAGFKSEKQVADIETVLVQKPNIIVSVPTDPVATQAAYKKAASQGVKIIFMGNDPKGLVAGVDYFSNVSPNDYGNGVASAHLMAQALGPNGGEVGMVFHAATDFFQTRQRYLGFKKTMADNYPNVKIVAEQGIGGPDFVGDAEKAASAMLTSRRNLKAIWAVWDVPAEGVIAAARAAGRDKLIITTVDLGQNVAIDMARGGYVKGVSAQRPYDQGVTEAMLAGYALLGKKAPTFVAWPIIPTTRDNVLAAWKQVYHTDAPDNVRKSMK
ncbi:MAG: sugar transporter, periplasmic binding protein [Massilia sp.]|nr:sugar transporter, periplasmic binding protein [Massilia sp.]